MGVAIYAVVKDKSPELEPLVIGISGKALARAIEDVEAIAQEASITPLMQFCSQDPAEIEDLLGDEGEGVDLPDEQWFDARDGLATVRALLESLRRSPARVDDAGEVITDLAAIERLLVAADRAGTSFHVAIDI
jgi:hypothetical protein